MLLVRSVLVFALSLTLIAGSAALAIGHRAHTGGDTVLLANAPGLVPSPSRHARPPPFRV